MVYYWLPLIIKYKGCKAFSLGKYLSLKQSLYKRAPVFTYVFIILPDLELATDGNYLNF